LTKDALLFDSNDIFHAEDTEHADVSLSKTTLSLQGRAWTIVYTAGGNQFTEAERAQPTIVAAAGLVVDLLMFYIFNVYCVDAATG